MEKLIRLNVFKFDKAQYFVEDTFWNAGLLIVNYKLSKFRIVSTVGLLEVNSVHELEEFAEDLLRRKHNVNFANK